MASIFAVMDEMSKQNKDISLFTHFLGSELKGRKGEKYGAMTIQVDEETHSNIARSILLGEGKKYRLALVVMDAEEFNEILKQKPNPPSI